VWTQVARTLLERQGFARIARGDPHQASVARGGLIREAQPVAWTMPEPAAAWTMPEPAAGCASALTAAVHARREKRSAHRVSFS
jgi:hypothetical protein